MMNDPCARFCNSPVGCPQAALMTEIDPHCYQKLLVSSTWVILDVFPAANKSIDTR